MNLLFIRMLHLQGPAVALAAAATAVAAIVAAFATHTLLDVWGPKWWSTMRPSAT
jgi:hypothetical protein